MGLEIKPKRAFEVDGESFFTRGEAELYVAKKMLRAMLEDSGVGHGSHWDADMIFEFFVDNHEQLDNLILALKRATAKVRAEAEKE